MFQWLVWSILGGLMGSLLVSGMFAARRDGVRRQRHLGDLSSRIDKLKRHINAVDDRLRDLELTDMKRRVKVGWVATYQHPEDRVSSFSILHFPGEGVIGAVHNNGLVLESGTFVPWSWVESVRPDEPKPEVPDTNAPGGIFRT